MKRPLACLILFTVLFGCSAGCSAGRPQHLQRSDWSEDVKAAVNDFIDMYGSSSDTYSKNSYVVSDFDNTASIFDMCEQFMVYQSEVMGYGFTPEELPQILSSGLGDMDKDLSALGFGKGSYRDWISDILSAYTHLYSTYGPFSPKGLDKEHAAIVQSDPMWREFCIKTMNMYFLIAANESSEVSYPWVTYFYTGMTDDEIYSLARESFAKYKSVNTSKKTIRTSDAVDSRVGVTEYTYTEGVQVTQNTLELWQRLAGAGIDVWVCSASESNVIRAAIDEFGLHDYCTGLIGMTPAVIDGKISYTYDYDSGYCWYAGDNGEWSRGNTASGAQTQGEGKVTAIENICVAKYGCGPLAGFMDSTGDYNFCTEFKSLKLVICFNRADRKVTDGGSVIAELAVYQKEKLCYTLDKANASGDTLYVLQGRDENGLRTLRNSSKTVRYGETEERLFRDKQNEDVYTYIVNNKMTSEDVINTFAVKTDENAKNNRLGFRYGFLDTFDGYHSK